MPLLLVEEDVRVMQVDERRELDARLGKLECTVETLGERGSGESKSRPIPLTKSSLEERAVMDGMMEMGGYGGDPGEWTDFLCRLLGGIVGVLAAEKGKLEDDG